MDVAIEPSSASPPDPWKVSGRDPARERELVRRLGVSPVTAHLLAARGLDEVDAARAYLEPRLSELLPPDDLPDVDVGAARLARAVEAGEPVLLYGDYDVDGTTGAAVLWEVLSALGAKVEAHVPDRAEGYGLQRARLERAVAEGVRVVVSIDNGIAALEAAGYLAGAGVDLVIADHHEFGEALPPACARVHPRLPGSRYGNPHLCGAGVAFKLAWATAARLQGGKPDRRTQDLLLACLGLVALGTVADMVELVGENRVIVRYGLRALAHTASPGLQALLALAKVEGVPSATDVGFRIAPRLNAAGRMGSARRAFELLTTRDPARAQALARELERENDARRTLQARVTEEAVAQVRAVYGERPQAAGLVVWGAGWPHGVVGIVAAKLTETFGRPALVVSTEGARPATGEGGPGAEAKGSGRTRGKVDLLASLAPCAGLLLRHGGHAAAVGLSVDPARLEDLRPAFDAGVRAQLGLGPDADPREVAARLDGYEVVADAEVGLDEVSRQLLDELERLAPFGIGNQEPLFAARAVTLAGEPRLLGDSGQHVAFFVRQGEQVLRTVAFSRPDLARELAAHARPGPAGPAPFSLAFRPRLNRWNGTTSVELELQAIRFGDAP